MILNTRIIRNIIPPTEIQVLLGAGVGGVFLLRDILRVNFKPIIFITNLLSNIYANFAKISFFGMNLGLEFLYLNH